MAQLQTSSADNELRWGRLGTALNTVNRELHPYIESELKTYFNQLPRYIHRVVV